MALELQLFVSVQWRSRCVHTGSNWWWFSISSQYSERIIIIFLYKQLFNISKLLITNKDDSVWLFVLNYFLYLRNYLKS